METMTFEFPADGAVAGRAHVGVVGSGDLEALVWPNQGGVAQVRVRTTVDGFAYLWQETLARFFRRHPLAGRYEINDCGATPGVIGLRLLQLTEARS